MGSSTDDGCVFERDNEISSLPCVGVRYDDGFTGTAQEKDWVMEPNFVQVRTKGSEKGARLRLTGGCVIVWISPAVEIGKEEVRGDELHGAGQDEFEMRSGRCSRRRATSGQDSRMRR